MRKLPMRSTARWKCETDLGLLDEMRGLAEIGLHSGRGDDAVHLALLGDGAGIGVVADLLVDRQRFPGQRRLIDAEVGARRPI